MGALFGKSKKPPSRVTEHDKVVLQLKQQRDKLKQYQKRIEITLEKDRELARKCLHSGRKERAKLLLRKKKYQETLLQNTDQQLENLEKMAADIEFAQIEQQVIDGLKAGNSALKKVHEVLTIEEVERVLDETNEAVEKQRELDELLSGALTQEDEDAVLAELDALVAADDASKVIPTENISENLPEVPSDNLGVEEEEEGRTPAKKVKENSQKRILVEA
ncbi:charged multivesicular body protein 6-A [Condylostylus longicornis]|uniref:charged multivesicular body protein 6-A n=1 Tax=Condylostylus longicornis TaxID=2530218 RepID=UPI00244E1C89|nr:charged multivesicular body protein 6-A [Condylostylus longicornis]